jgi:hypothetical protein
MRNEYHINSFEDLVFRPHPNGYKDCVCSAHRLDNGITISIIGGDYARFYGDGINTFEIAAWETETKKYLCLSEITSFSGDDVLGWLSKEEITEVIQILNEYQIQEEY